MRCFAIGILREVDMGPAIVEYLERIDDTLAPYSGRFIVHGGAETVFEGATPGTIVIIEFPDREAAERWYRSSAYQQIAPLRAEHSRAPSCWSMVSMSTTERSTCSPETS